MDLLGVLFQLCVVISLAAESRAEERKNEATKESKFSLFNTTQFEGGMGSSNRAQFVGGGKGSSKMASARLKKFTSENNKNRRKYKRESFRRQNKKGYKKPPKNAKRAGDKAAIGIIRSMNKTFPRVKYERKELMGSSSSASHPQYYEYEEVLLEPNEMRHENSNDLSSLLNLIDPSQAQYQDEYSSAEVASSPPPYPGKENVDSSINVSPPSYVTPSSALSITPAIEVTEKKNFVSINRVEQQQQQPSISKSPVVGVDFFSNTAEQETSPSKTNFPQPSFSKSYPQSNGRANPRSNTNKTPNTKTRISKGINVMSKMTGYRIQNRKPSPESSSRPVRRPLNNMIGGYSQQSGPKKDQKNSQGGGMRYSFEWSVLDEATSNDYLHRQSSDGQVTDGQYEVLLPDGRRQIVMFRVDGDSGYQAQVTYEGEATVSLSSSKGRSRHNANKNNVRGYTNTANQNTKIIKAVPSSYTI